MPQSSLRFDEKNLFPQTPLLGESSGSASGFTYAEAQAHSTLVDAYLGLETEAIEARLSRQNAEQDQNLWYGLPTQTLMTPYTELRLIIDQLKLVEGQNIVDLGAAYGRMGFVVAHHAPGVTFTGYEMVPERVREGERCMRSHGLSESIRLIEADLSSNLFKPIDADAYFLYDYGSRRAIDKTLNDLAEIRSRRRFRVIGRGRAVRDAVERKYPWLSEVYTPEHYPHYSIYQS